MPSESHFVNRLYASLQPTCHMKHLPPFVQKYDQLKEKGIDVVAVVAANDPFVMSGWSRAEGLKDKVNHFRNFFPDKSFIGTSQILALSDTYAEWSKKLGLSVDLTAAGLGVRTARFALILDDLVVKYIGVSRLLSDFLSGLLF